MKLADAIEEWIAAHGGGLSASTVEDIDAIAVAVTATGNGEIDSGSVDSSTRVEIAKAADTSLSGKAIGVFLSTVASWVDEQAEAEIAADDLEDTEGDTDLEDTELEDAEGDTDLEGTALEDAEGDTDLEGTELEDTEGDTDLEDAELEDTDLEDTELEDTDLEDTELEASDLDEADLEDRAAEGAVAEGAVTEGAVAEDPADDSESSDSTEAAASSFLRAIDSSPAPNELVDVPLAEPLDADDEVAAAGDDDRSKPGGATTGSLGAFGDLTRSSEDPAPGPAQADTGGAFTSAAQQPRERRVDMIAVMYFTIAAICFAFVIYLWATS